MFSSIRAATSRWVSGPNGELPLSSLPLVKLFRSTEFCLQGAIGGRTHGADGQVRNDEGIAKIKAGEKHTYHYHTVHSQTTQATYNSWIQKALHKCTAFDPAITQKTNHNSLISMIFDHPHSVTLLHSNNINGNSSGLLACTIRIQEILTIPKLHDNCYDLHPVT